MSDSADDIGVKAGGGRHTAFIPSCGGGLSATVAIEVGRPGIG
jgi:hypothetical protein